METISGKIDNKSTSLLTWENNKNGANEMESHVLDEMIRELYITFFKNCFDSIKKSFNHFCRDWLVYCDHFKSVYIKELKDNNVITPKWQTRMWYKFRGNVFEILLEKLFIEGAMSNIFRNKYITPDNRQHEDFTDAHVYVGKFLVGIQAKNHSREIGHAYFIKASDMYAREIFDIPTEDIEEYRKEPRQYICSMSPLNKTFKNTHHEYDGRVGFIGPDEFDKIFKDAKPNLQIWFDEIIDEIKNYSYN